MGSASSISQRVSKTVAPDATHKQENNRRYTVKLKSDKLKNVEQFIFQVYLNFPSAYCVTSMMSSDLATSSLKKFLLSVDDPEYLLLFHDCERILFKSHTANSSIGTDFESLFQEYIFPRLIASKYPKCQPSTLISNDLRTACFNALTISKEDPNFAAVVNDLCERLRNESMTILGENYFSEYLLSKCYTEWRLFESGHSIATSIDDIRQRKREITSVSNIVYSQGYLSESMSEEKSESFATLTIPFPASRSDQFGNRKLLDSESDDRDLSSAVFSNIEDTYLPELLTGENWLAVLLAAAEALPIGFSLSRIYNRDGRDVPLIYVNNFFVHNTGFSRSSVADHSIIEVLGIKELSPVEAEKIETCCEEGSNISAVVMCRSSDGRLFSNSACFRTVFQQGSHVPIYLIGIYVDVSNQIDQGRMRMKLSNFLMNILPNEVVIDECLFSDGN